MKQLKLKGNLGNGEEHDPSKKRIPHIKIPSKKRETYSIDMEELQRLIKRLSNEIIDLNKLCGKSTT